MSLTRINTVEDFIKILPAIVEEKKKLKNYWSPSKLDDFVNQLFSSFSQGFCFGEQREGKLLYFCYLLKQEENIVFCWLFFVDKELYGQTKEIILTLKSWCKAQGFTKIMTTTNRNQSSYRRWANKIGLTPSFTTYEGDL